MLINNYMKINYITNIIINCELINMYLKYFKKIGTMIKYKYMYL